LQTRTCSLANCAIHLNLVSSTISGTFQGYVSKAKSKLKCKQKENGKYKWNADELSKCITCEPEKLKFDDDRIERNCVILTTTRLRKCTVKCSNKEKLFGQKKIEMECKCPRKGFVSDSLANDKRRVALNLN